MLVFFIWKKLNVQKAARTEICLSPRSPIQISSTMWQDLKSPSVQNGWCGPLTNQSPSSWGFQPLLCCTLQSSSSSWLIFHTRPLHFSSTDPSSHSYFPHSRVWIESFALYYLPLKGVQSWSGWQLNYWQVFLITKGLFYALLKKVYLGFILSPGMWSFLYFLVVIPKIWPFWSTS